jgi:hypothetical protein
VLGRSREEECRAVRHEGLPTILSSAHLALGVIIPLEHACKVVITARPDAKLGELRCQQVADGAKPPWQVG